nr:hypothetical protein JVH1_0384 [Rhodococcus sp. JVH1]
MNSPRTRGEKSRITVTLPRRNLRSCRTTFLTRSPKFRQLDRTTKSMPSKSDLLRCGARMRCGRQISIVQTLRPNRPTSVREALPSV